MKVAKLMYDLDRRVTRSMTRMGLRLFSTELHKIKKKRDTKNIKRNINRYLSDEKQKILLIRKVRNNINKKVSTGKYSTDFLLRENVLEWLFYKNSYLKSLDKKSELDWGHSIIGYKTNQWTTKFGEKCLYEILELLDKNPKRIDKRMKGENGKELVPDWIADDGLYECKARTYMTTGSAGEKILGTPDKYKECYRLYNKPLKIVCMGYQEKEAENDFCRFSPSSVEGKKILDFYKREFQIEYIRATDLLKELC